MGEVIQFPVKQFREEMVVHHDPIAEGQPSLWGCMDDRAPETGDPVIGNELYRQHGGGIDGIAKDVVVAMETMAPGSYINQGKPLHVMTKTINNILVPKGIVAVHHGPACAALVGGPAIGETTASAVDPDNESFLAELAATANDIFPGADEERVARVSHITGRLLSKKRVAKPEDTIGYMASKVDGPPVPQTNLADDHEQQAIIVNYLEKTALRVRAARKAGLAVLHASMGDIREIHGAIYPFIPIDRDALMIATATRLAAIRERYLFGPNGQKLQIVQLGKAA